MNLILLITTSIAWILYAAACITSMVVILYCKKADELYKKFEKFLILRDDEDKMFLLFGNTIVYLATFVLIGTFTYSYLIYHDILNKAAVLMALENSKRMSFKNRISRQFRINSSNETLYSLFINRRHNFYICAVINKTRTINNYYLILIRRNIRL